MNTYCVLNPILQQNTNKPVVINKNDSSPIFDGLSHCGIKVMLPKKYIVQEPDVIIFLKGEIYNKHKLCEFLHIKSNTTAEEVIINLYKNYGMDYTLQVLDGVYSFILFDYYYKNEISSIYIVKDLFGILPFHCCTNENTNSVIIGEKNTYTDFTVYPLDPGCYSVYELSSKVSAEWVLSTTVNKPFFLLPNSIVNDTYKYDSMNIIEMSKCIKKIILKISTVCDRIANLIVEKLLLQIDCDNDQKNDIYIYDDMNEGLIYYSPINFFTFSEICDNIFEYDKKVRDKLYSTDFLPKKKYPFYDKSFVNFYFTIPLQIRYQYHIDSLAKI